MYNLCNTTLYLRAPSLFTQSKLPSAYSIRLVLLGSPIKRRAWSEYGSRETLFLAGVGRAHEESDSKKKSLISSLYAVRVTCDGSRLELLGSEIKRELERITIAFLRGSI